MQRAPQSAIESIGVYLPPKVVTTDEVLQGCANEVRFPLEELTGIQSRRMAGETEFSIDLARRAVADCLARSRRRPEEIDLLICANISRYDAPGTVTFEPSTAIALKRHFGLDRALAFDVTNACAGMFTAICAANDLIRAGLVGCAVVASGEYITHLTQTAQREIQGYMDPQLACLTLGDAGAAVLLAPSPSEEVGFHGIELYTLAKYCPLCVAKPTAGPDGGAAMVTDSIRATAAVVEHLTKVAAHVLRASPRPLDAFQHIIPHQTSSTSIREGLSEVARLFGRNLGAMVIDNVAQRGNTASNTHFVAVRDQIDRRTIKSGDSAMFCFSGSGITVGAALYTFDDLPDRIDQLPAEPADADSPLAAAPASRRIHHRFAEGSRVRVESVGTALPGRDGLPRQTEALARRAAEACLKTSSYRRSEIGLLLHAGVYRTEFVIEPTMAAVAANALRMNLDADPQDDERTLTFDLINGGAGFLDACFLAAGMIRAGRFRTAMVLASEVENNADAGLLPLRGLREAASAVILDRSPRPEAGLRCFLAKDYTEHLDAFRSEAVAGNSGTTLVFHAADDLEDRYVACLADAVEDLLEAERIERSDIQLVIPPQISPTLVARLAAAAGFSPEQVVDVSSAEGDLFTSSASFALEHVRDRAPAPPGSLALLLAVGAGIQVRCALYRY
jgi:3-oxoacyl-[acyl-carrier-protein] synthase III